MKDLRSAFYILGVLLSALSIIMLVPAAVDAAVSDIDWKVFTVSAMVTGFVGVSLVLTLRGAPIDSLGPHEAFLITFISWIGLSGFSAIPFLFSNLGLDYADALFEAVSGITTTGSTVLTQLENIHDGILIWRSLLQWVGGIGIIVMAIALLPMMRIGGMQLFRTESSDRSDKVFPRLRQLTTAILTVYVALTAACAIALWVAGMGFFDAVNHALTTLATGGYSTRDASIAAFDSPLVEVVIIVFMMLGGITFTLHVRAAHGDPGALWRDSQVRWFVAVLVAATACLTLWLVFDNGMTVGQALRHAAFNVVSITTTTGYASADYALWGGLAFAVFYFLTFVGGCTGSTSGAIKIFRFQVFYAVARQQLARTLMPHRVYAARVDGKEITDPVAVSVLAFFFFYALTFAVTSMSLSLYGLDAVTTLSGAATAIGNVGPGLGPVIGPAGNFASLPDGAKLILAAGMLLGRLEFVTVFILLFPGFWRE